MGKIPPRSEISRPLENSLSKSAKRIAAILGMSVIGVLSPLPNGFTTNSSHSNAISSKENIKKAIEANQNKAVKKNCQKSRGSIECALAHADNRTRALYSLDKNKPIASEKSNHKDLNIAGKIFEVRETIQTWELNGKQVSLFILKNKETNEESLIGDHLQRGVGIIKLSYQNRSGIRTALSESKSHVGYPEATASEIQPIK